MVSRGRLHEWCSSGGGTMMSQPADAGREHAHDPRGADAIGNADEEMIRRAVAGDAFAVHSLLLAHRPRLLEYVLRQMPHKLRSIYDAEDVVHDVFVGLPEALRRYEERGSFAAWLRKITARVALARLRESNARPAVDLDGAQVAALTQSSDASLTLERALRELSPGLRAVVVLKEIEGFSHAEIAAMLDISVGASEVRLHRALHALRATLKLGKNK